jgi:integral membrane protein
MVNLLLIFAPEKFLILFLMIKSFKIVALLEGVSLLLLLFFAMPMKYICNMPQFVKVVGMAHGLLFIGYIIMAVMLKSQEKWPVKKFLFICLASVIPFGTFYMERKYFRSAGL